MSQDLSTRNSPDGTGDLSPFEETDAAFIEPGPSLPIILVSAACGIAGGVIGLYITYTVLGWELPASVFVAILFLCLGLGLSGAGLTVLTGSRATVANIAMSCGIIAVSVLFFGLCVLVGAVAGALLLAAS